VKRRYLESNIFAIRGKEETDENLAWKLYKEKGKTIMQGDDT
jgi:hypothetical protein